MNVVVYGAGYVGLVSAACFAHMGHRVVCVDVDEARIAALLDGQCPLHEEGLPAMLKEQIHANRLVFTSNLSEAVPSASLHVIAVGTPGREDGSADLSQVYDVASQVVKHAATDGVLVIKSTVPVGTGDLLAAHVHRQLQEQKKNQRIHLASNPEFLREGSAVYDFLNADRIVIGGNRAALDTLTRFYEPLVQKGIPLLTMSQRSAELTKYAANALLATKISFINYISQLAQQTGANIDEVREGMALDHRIGPHFLQPGIGYGGSCFPKDVKALSHSARLAGLETRLLDAVERVNHQQKQWLVRQLSTFFNEKLAGLNIGLWGLAFKPGTDDLREASSLVILKALLDAKANVFVYDPAAMNPARELFKGEAAITWLSSARDVLQHKLHALAIITEWPEFKHYPLVELQKQLGTAPVFDGRNCYCLEAATQAGLLYYSVGRPVVNQPLRQNAPEEASVHEEIV
ncbi:UDP-glucose/GDP-mannose dehydrogenase family protein [Legionella taurinensis]|uniref:UDP-glucose 6-dehydrogenase n=1 Tax=Legionella taurinensis TaxID=70611 RepID=A0AB38N7A0_9GAMM|nr:UDP-glucose/GDP-mannose dehydrogenase family protein [Legionella taurinensis]MDX1836645.1 UDP-glucose/GDP-mannose dehydrogenase family protein [Legionella taurinensis]PUT42899.1 UDP-glucose 6-dehydrogenase [Legionella taurinensis]PUT45454.1 UDP-glucose 6-dehydrogenase [Legionella taurinensis]PUT46971.1 UDP-glucose 6-dehydrogenase [Legionella taurinensis]PUT49221.1 UDP-glucose 6-dehydrogenase [Legionella taurinensis]